ncbi:hypothetical protein [Lysobacter sp. A289]
MKTAITIAAFLVLTSCTYGEPTSRLELDYAIADDESKVAISAERYVVQRATGISALPSGGFAKITAQMVDVYVVDLTSGKILYKHAVDPPGERSMTALETWLLGWKGDDVYLKMTGCESGFRTSYKGCGPERRKTYVYKVSRHDVEPAGVPVPRLRRHRVFGGIAGADSPGGTRSYLSTTETDGVWIHRGARGPREPLLRVNGHELEQVAD